MHKKKQSLFDAASEIYDKKKKKKVAPNSKTPVKVKKVAVKPKLPSDPETIEMMEKMRAMQEDFTQKLQAIYAKNKVTQEDVDKYLSDPKNFTPAEWKAIQELQKEMTNSRLVKAEAKKTAALTEKNLKRKRTTKTIGARKQWMPMK